MSVPAHGTRARYAGHRCRCLLCRAANAAYEAGRQRARREGVARPGRVNAGEAREHLLRLKAAGVSYNLIAEASGVPDSTIWLITSGRRTCILASTERRILAVQPDAQPFDGALVDAGPTHRRIDELIEQGGFTRTEIARRLGYKSPALRIRVSRVTMRTHARIEKLWRQYIRRGLQGKPLGADAKPARRGAA